MRTVSGATETRAAARRRAARAKWASRRAWWVRSIRTWPRRENPLRVAGICFVLALVLASAWFHSELIPFSFSLRSPVADRGERHDPFAQTRVGEILFTPFDGNACRKVRFSNQTGWLGPDEYIRCDSSLPPDYDAVVGSIGASDRLNVIRRAFTTNPAQ